MTTWTLSKFMLHSSKAVIPSPFSVTNINHILELNHIRVAFSTSAWRPLHDSIQRRQIIKKQLKLKLPFDEVRRLIV